MTSSKQNPLLFPELAKGTVDSNSYEYWVQIHDHLEVVGRLLINDLGGKITETVEKATEICAHLFCVLLENKRSPAELGFKALYDQVRGKNEGAKILTWVMIHVTKQISNDFKVVWAGYHAPMASTIQMLIDELEEKYPTFLPVPPVSEVVAWIKSREGMAGLHRDYVQKRRVEQREEKEIEADAAVYAENQRRLIKAKKAGYKTVEEWEQATRDKLDKERKALLEARFEAVKARLIKNGTKLREGDPVPDGTLLISHGGALYIISPDDLFTLLQCSASML